MIEQKEVIIGDVKVPVIVEDGVTYYPISYLSEKVLLRENLMSTQQANGEYAYGIKFLKIKYGEHNTQNVKCISKECLIHRLSNIQSARLNTSAKERQNILHDHLGIEKLNFLESVVKKINKKYLLAHDEYTLSVIDECIKYNEFIEFQLCNKCEKYYPLDSRFFHKDNRLKRGYFQICLVCEGYKFFKSENEEVNKIKKAGEDLYKALNEDNLIDIYKAYIEGRIRFLPEKYSNKENYLEIVKWLIDERLLLVKDLSVSELYKTHRLTHIKSMMSTNDIHFELFGSDCVNYLWKYPSFQSSKKHTFKYAKILFDNYLQDQCIEIIDKFNFKYGNTVVKARIRLNDLLGFVVYYHDYSDAGYKYSVAGSNYYKKDENVIFDLKYLIEEDMKIDLNKIPLYLTKMSLRKNADPLYNYIVIKKNGNLFEWVNKIYPDKFNELDFDINYYREFFDSIEEGQIHELLVSELRSVIYNGKIDGRRLFIIGGMEPDWLVIRDDKCWIIEYFGMYSDRGAYNTRTEDYVEKTKLKIGKYEKLDYYEKIYLYPEDLKKDFEGVKNKVAILK